MQAKTGYWDYNLRQNNLQPIHFNTLEEFRGYLSTQAIETNLLKSYLFDNQLID